MHFSCLSRAAVVAVALAGALPLGAAAQEAGTDAATRCVEIAGPPDAGVPVSRAALDAYFAALEQARPDCAAAVEADPSAAAARFNLAVLAERRGAHDEALEHYRAAADAGLAAARTKLGDYANFGIGPVEEDHARAVAQYRAAAEAGDAPGLTTLAFMYRYGRGVPRDTARMVDLMGQAAEAGYHFAQYRLGQTYHRGDGIPGGENVELGVPDGARAVRLYRAAAEQGNVFAALELAGLYADDRFDVPADAALQAEWTRRAAEGGTPEALNALGFLHEIGRGVARDAGRAAELYVEALEAGLDFGDLRGRFEGRAPGWDDATARAFQTILQERGLYDGPIDGIVGRGTAAGARELGG
ncbi:hypothetical protein C2I36_07755 [Rhodobacteraceae bacterium WD3A24]|nr:hypothetical protein C2I36_07755 [Rhodobacteraceae bacterium WD3A24]